MARTPQDSTPLPSDATMVTYVPRFDGDPANTEVHGLKFKANVPRPISDPRVIEMAKGNPWFTVGSEKPAPLPTVGKPTSDVQYRQYAVAWVQNSKSSEEMTKRWDAEEELRTDCGVGSDDIEYVRAFFDPKFEKLKRAEAEARNELR